MDAFTLTPAEQEAFDVLVITTEPQWTETVETFHATSYAEALTMAERKYAGVADMLFGIVATAKNYTRAKAEGIQFNEADGLLID